MKKGIIKYGDEELGYEVLATEMSPSDARKVLETNKNDGIYESMPDKRRIALELKGLEKEIQDIK